MAVYTITIETDVDPELNERDAYLVVRGTDAQSSSGPIARVHLMSRRLDLCPERLLVHDACTALAELIKREGSWEGSW